MRLLFYYVCGFLNGACVVIITWCIVVRRRVRMFKMMDRNRRWNDPF
jgi:hypothetical protein